MVGDAWFLIAMSLSFAAYGVYLLSLRRAIVRPNRASWLIWSASAAAEALTYQAVNPGSPQSWVFVLSAGCCMVVTGFLWRRSNWASPTNIEAFCIAACLFALLIWVAFRETFWAHMLVVAAVPVSFWPTWASVWKDRGAERSPAWGLWTLGDLATLLVAVRAGGAGVDELAYIFVELACHASIWFMIGLATLNPLRSLGWNRRGLLVLDRYRHPRNLFAVGENHLGKAVYAICRFGEGAELMRFTGRHFHVDDIPSLMRGSDDRFVQVTPDHYMGPSGQLDDLVNHSCDPNAGLRFTDHGVILVAIRPIAAGDEVTWDYSTTLAQSNWHMICQCRAPACRRVIGNFETLTPDRQEFFRARNLVAPYLRRKDTLAPVRRAS
ncbi:SET domain-containing protein-lysine N-methyltransferase [Sphingomonas sp. ST-64]|uniref:SET domain-containing protein-lysine N-methyltransferase n=1 Tax=Sphingomonas plantiphila TaxID=3163295 RepID=A0ABW8YRF0_9SPHN